MPSPRPRKLIVSRTTVRQLAAAAPVLRDAAPASLPTAFCSIIGTCDTGWHCNPP